MKKPRLLIIDDEPVIIKNMAYILGECGFDVLSAETKEKAVQIIEKEHLDIVIADIRLLDGNGGDILSRLCSKYPNIRYLLHTGDHNFQITEEMVACGFTQDDILYKPIPSIRELAERLHNEMKNK